MKIYKYPLAFALTLAFFCTITTDVLAQTTPKSEAMVKIGQNVLRFVITKDTKDAQLNLIKERLTEKSITVNFNNLKRNSNKEITGIEIDYSSKVSEGKHFSNSEAPIHDIEIAYNVNEGNLMVGQSSAQLSQSFKVSPNENKTLVKSTEAKEKVFVYSSDDEDEKVVVIDKNGEKQYVTPDKKVYVVISDSENDSDEMIFIQQDRGAKSNDTIWIKRNIDKVIWTDDNGKTKEINASEKEKKKDFVYKSTNARPLFLLDEIEITQDEMTQIDPNTIESVNVYKDDAAIKQYGEKGKNGVVAIKLKQVSNNEQNGNTYKIINEVIATESINGNDESTLTFYISKDTSDEHIEQHKASLKAKDIVAKIYNIKRNENGEITRINISLKNKNGSEASSAYINEDGIKKIGFGIRNGELFVITSK